MRAIAAGLLAAAAAGLLPGVGPAAAEEPRNLAGASVGMLSAPFGFDDPYSWMLGATLFYERRVSVLDTSWVLGARLSGYGQYSRLEPFGDSRTICGGGTLGWEAARRLDEAFAFSVVPFAGFGLYWRSLEHDGHLYTASRPMVLAGIAVDLQLGRRLSAGTSIEPVVIMDREPLLAVGQNGRVGLRF